MTQVSVNFRKVTAIAAWKVDWEENIVRAGTADKLTSRQAGCPGSVGESQRKGRTGVSTGPSAKNLKPRRGEVSRLRGLADSLSQIGHRGGGSRLGRNRPSSFLNL